MKTQAVVNHYPFRPVLESPGFAYLAGLGLGTGCGALVLLLLLGVLGLQ
jgi:hypothetical protein